MHKRNATSSFGKILALAVVIGGGVHAAAAQPPSAEIARLGKDLTPVGAEKGGNKDASIPAWTGGDMNAPGGWKPGQPRPNPYAQEKPLFSIDASNVDQHKERLSPGQIEVIKTFKGHRLDVYPTHRSCGYPTAYYDRTRQNASTARMGENGRLAEALGAAVPFPLPQSGEEVMWNHKLRWHGEGAITPSLTVLPPRGGDSLGQFLVTQEWQTSPMWSLGNKGVADANDIETYFIASYTQPPSVAGDMTLTHYKISAANDVWLYFASQRRVRRAPTYQYDAPVLNLENMMTADQYLMFNGPLDRYDFKLAGKKEMYVPYNWYKMNSGQVRPEDLVTPKDVKPDAVRYERHRVWVVDAALKPDMRHVFTRRTFYVDEDSWHILAVDLYDAQNKIQRTMESGVFMAWEIPACVEGAYVNYDIPSVRYLADRLAAGQTEGDYLAKREKRMDESMFVPDGLRRMSTR